MTDNYLGEIRLFSSGTTQFIPDGWLPCEGQILQVSQYRALFALIGNKFGGDAKTTFALPDFRGRTPIGILPGNPNYGTIGGSGGSASIVLSIAEIPIHNHTVIASQSTGGKQPVPSNNFIGIAADYASPAVNMYAPMSNPPVPLSATSFGQAGGSQGHENRQPVFALRFYIATTGIYPTQQ